MSNPDTDTPATPIMMIVDSPNGSVCPLVLFEGGTWRNLSHPHIKEYAAEAGQVAIFEPRSATWEIREAPRRLPCVYSACFSSDGEPLATRTFATLNAARDFLRYNLSRGSIAIGVVRRPLDWVGDDETE